MGAMILRALTLLGGRTSFEVIDGAALSMAPWWATDALRSAGFTPAVAVRVKPMLMPASTTLLLVHEERRADARVGFASAPEPVVGLTSYFAGGLVNTGQTGAGPLPYALHQALPGIGLLELVAAHWRAQELVTARTALLPCEGQGALDRYRASWFAELEAMRGLSRDARRALIAQSDDGGALRGVPLDAQPGIADRLDALVGPA